MKIKTTLNTFSNNCEIHDKKNYSDGRTTNKWELQKYTFNQMIIIIHFMKKKKENVIYFRLIKFAQTIYYVFRSTEIWL